MPRETGFPRADAQDDFLRARRRAVLGRMAARMRREPRDVNLVVPFDEVVEALGRIGERDLGMQSIALDSIVGSVNRPREFDRAFRPTSSKVRTRWERIAGAQRRGESMPPISVYRVGDAHFVRDGHHRVSVARAQGLATIDAYVTEVQTRVGADRSIRLADLPLKGHERLFDERVPLPAARRERVRLSDAWKYGDLAEGVEAWGFRAMQDRGELMDRAEVAEAWYEHEFEPVVAMLEEAGLIGEHETPADAYERLGGERYRLMRTMEWNEDVVERLRGDRRARG